MPSLILSCKALEQQEVLKGDVVTDVAGKRLYAKVIALTMR